jgi:ankyrin repeat protein
MRTIFELIDTGDASALRELLAREPQAAAARDERGLSALMRAAYRGGDVFAAVRDARPPLDPFDRVIVGEADGLPAPDAWTPDGFTGLHMAAFADNPRAAERLADAGADVDAISRASFAQVTPLGTAAFRGATAVARVLLEHGADSSIAGGSEGGDVPLHVAAMNDDRALVELLLAHGADRAARNAGGLTAADLATSDDVRALLTV